MSSESDFADDFSDDDLGGAGRKSSGGRDDDDDFEFGESYNDSPAARGRGSGGKGRGAGEKESTQLQNQPFDEAVDLSDEDSLGTSVDTIDPMNTPKVDHGESKSGSGAGSSDRACGRSGNAV